MCAPCCSRVIVALDVPERDTTLDLARRLGPEAAMVKVGLEAFVGHGPDLVRAIVNTGTRVFLDLKIHDIPRTAAAAAKQARSLGVHMLTIHAAGGAEMVRAVRDALGGCVHIVAVTMLTSLDDNAARDIGFGQNVGLTAERLARLALGAGADGLVCSAHELERLSPLGGTRVVPGVRPAGASHGDQKRVASPADAMRAGASWLVVGRPILDAPDPLETLRSINKQIHQV